MSSPASTPPPTPIGQFCRGFQRVYCVSLTRSQDRRAYIQQYFSELGIDNYEFLAATDNTDPLVADYYNRGLVATFPPCFRCGKISCGSDDCNNVLIPSQVATFITYLRLWQAVVESGTETALVVEDDVRFTDYAAGMATALTNENLLGKIDMRGAKPVLLRLGWALSDEHKATPTLSVTNGAIRMANPCHAINLAFAKLLLERFKKIDTTVDIFQHQMVGATTANFTVLPPLAFELSWSVGAVDSLIHPKPVRVAYLEQFHPGNTALIGATKQALQNHVAHILYRQLLVVGHPRCGSGFMSKALQAMGLDVGHESMGRHGISSWMFAVQDDEVPYALDKYSVSRKLTHFQYSIHHVRDPRAAAPSIMRENKYSPNSLAYRRKHIQARFGIDLEDAATELEKAILSYVYWNRIIEASGTDMWMRAEDGPERLADLLVGKGVLAQRPVIAASVPTDYNSRKPYKGVVYEKPGVGDADWRAVRGDILEMLNTQCVKYGYPTFEIGADAAPPA